MRITNFIKPRDGMDIAHSMSGQSAKNIYWSTFERWPSDISWHIDNAQHPEEVEKWAIKEGFTLEAVSVNIPRSEDGNWADRSYSLYVHRNNKYMLIAGVSYDERMSLALFHPVEAKSFALVAYKTLLEKIGTIQVSGRINLLAMEHGDFHLMSMEIPKPDLDLVLNYGRGFNVVHSEIREILNSKESGLILLHGVSGSGKSTYIYHLIHEFKHKMIFIPNNIVSSMAMPDFIQFLLLNAKNSVLIIEDAEKVLLKRGAEGDSGVSTLLNITDGILGKLLNCKVICTFNVERTQLDTALLRKGRLRKEHEFGELSIEDTNRLFKHLGKDRQSNEPLVLADIYNETGGRDTNQAKLGF